MKTPGLEPEPYSLKGRHSTNRVLFPEEHNKENLIQISTNLFYYWNILALPPCQTDFVWSVGFASSPLPLAVSALTVSVWQYSKFATFSLPEEAHALGTLATSVCQHGRE